MSFIQKGWLCASVPEFVRTCARVYTHTCVRIVVKIVIDIFRSSLYYEGVRRYHDISKPLNCSCDINKVNNLLLRLRTIHGHCNSVKLGTIERSFINVCINENICLIQKNVKIVIAHLLLVKKVLANIIRQTKLTEKITYALCANIVPDIWKTGWTSEKMQCDNTDLNTYIDMIAKVLDYLLSIFSASGEVCTPFDLSNFNNPKKLINAIKLEHAMKNGSNVESDVWIAKVCIFTWNYLFCKYAPSRY